MQLVLQLPPAHDVEHVDPVAHVKLQWPPAHANVQLPPAWHVKEQLPLLHVCEQLPDPHEQEPPAPQSIPDDEVTTQLSAMTAAPTPRSETKILIL